MVRLFICYFRLAAPLAAPLDLDILRRTVRMVENAVVAAPKFISRSQFLSLSKDRR